MTWSRPRIIWEPRDVWVGLFWKTTLNPVNAALMASVTRFYLCLVPCLPITWTVTRYEVAHDDSGAL